MIYFVIGVPPSVLGRSQANDIVLLVTLRISGIPGGPGGSKGSLAFIESLAGPYGPGPAKFRAHTLNS